MKGMPLALLVLALVAPLSAQDLSDKTCPAKTTEAKKETPDKAVHRCNVGALDAAAKASDTAGIKKALGDSAVEGTAGSEKIKMPGDMGDRGAEAGNPLCHHEVWNIASRYFVGSGKAFNPTNTGLTALKAQVDLLKTIDSEFFTLDTKVEEAVAEAEEVLSLGEKLGAITLDPPKVNKVQNRPGEGGKAIKETDRKDYVVKGNAEYKTKGSKIKGKELAPTVFAIISCDQGDDKTDVVVGKEVLEFDAKLGAVRNQAKKFAAAISSDLAAKVAIPSDHEDHKGKLSSKVLTTELALLAKSKGAWEAPDPGASRGGTGFGSLDWAAQDRLSIYGNAVLSLVAIAGNAHIARTVALPGSEEAAADPAKPGVVATSGAGDKIKKFRDVFEKRTRDEINAGIDARTDLDAAGKDKLKKEYAAGSAVIVEDATGAKSVEFRVGPKTLGTAAIPAGLTDANAESEAAKAAKPVSDAILAGDDFKAKVKAAAVAVGDPEIPPAPDMAGSLAAGGAVGLKSDRSCSGAEKVTQEDIAARKGERRAATSGKKSAARTRANEVYADDLDKADKAFNKCARYSEDAPFAAIQDGKIVLIEKLPPSDGGKRREEILKGCKKTWEDALKAAKKKRDDYISLHAKGEETEAIAAYEAEVGREADERAAKRAIRQQIRDKVRDLAKKWPTEDIKSARSYVKKAAAAEGAEDVSAYVDEAYVKRYFEAYWPVPADLKKALDDNPGNDNYKRSRDACEPRVRYYTSGAGENDDVEKCVGILLGQYITSIKSGGTGGADGGGGTEVVAPPAGGGDDAFDKAKCEDLKKKKLPFKGMAERCKALGVTP